MNRLKSGLVALAMIAALAVASPVGAITYGELDGGEHPYVGFMIFFDATDPGWYSCSGTLLDADTFLTAGHCTYPVASGGADDGAPGGTDVWVTFDPTDTLAGWPARADYPDEQSLYEARSEWLNDNPEYVKGTAIPDPKYDDFAGFPVNYDIGVVELKDDVVMSTYGVLAPLGTAETLAGTPSKRNSALVETVGYGVQAIQPHPQEDETRYKSTSRIVSLNGSISRGGNLHTLNNPSAVGGRGGSCFGDSGGPVFVNDTNEVLAVVSFGFSGTCHGADYSWRVDTQSAYDFILQYVDA